MIVYRAEQLNYLRYASDVVAIALLLPLYMFCVVNIYDEVVMLLSFEHFVLNNKHV